MSVKGRFGVEVLFTDAAVVDGAKSLKTIAISHATEYDFGKIAVVTGTVGTAATVMVNQSPTTYRNSAGDFVSFANISRVAFVASGTQLVRVTSGDSGQGLACSMSSMPSVANVDEDSGLEVAFVNATAGTSAYTLVMYGS
jgi:hypothetical protein